MIRAGCCTPGTSPDEVKACLSVHKCCHDCGHDLTPESRFNDDPYAAFCKRCWVKREAESEDPTCETCGEAIQQDPEDLWCIECPNGCTSGRLVEIVAH